MAHQIKNPLQAVAMNLEVIRMRVRKDAPGLWEELERFAGAVDENVELLDRRLRLLLALGRRSTDDPTESVDLPALVRDFASALRLDADPPALRVEAEGPEVAAEARPGYVLALVLAAWDHARAGGGGAGELEVRVRRGDGDVRMEVPVAGEAPERWRRLAEAAGGRLEEDGDGGVLGLVLPRG
jgi:signal transduction histidine kinase